MKNYTQIRRTMDIMPIQASPGDDRQSSEAFSAIVNGERRDFSMHDYRSMYAVPDLYDAMMYGMLMCETPERLTVELSAKLGCDHYHEPLRVLDIGAGSGAFAEQLRRAELKIDKIVGLDIFPLAKQAAMRDRPRAYDDYVVCDLTALEPEHLRSFEELAPNCVAVASATGWGNHIPVEGFQNAFDLLEDRGWFVFHVKPNDPDPECVALNEWIDQLIDRGEIQNVVRDEIFHRWNTAGEKIHYSYVIGQKALN